MQLFQERKGLTHQLSNLIATIELIQDQDATDSGGILRFLRHGG